ncbi:MAG TPA: hypothetical protein VLH39_07970 [Magnetospirillaceae bacterium]|nr:hypothetical protein [Magnetospirillaceae bacterium]
MKRLLLNGSPRGESSNSRLICSWLAEGMAEAGVPAPGILTLAGSGGTGRAVESFRSSDEIVLVFPLYTDSMPGIVAAFTNALADLDPAVLAGKRIGYVVHSGFPESAQSEPAAAYLDRLSARLGLVRLGTAVKGGSEGLRLNPGSGRSKTADRFRALGRSLIERGAFDPDQLAALARPRRLGLGLRILFQVLAPTGLLQMYWDVMLKRHGAYERRFDRPYAPLTRPSGRS